MSLAEPPEGTERRDRTGPPRHLRRASSPGAPGSEELQFCYCRQKQHGLMVCCDGCGEWFHSRCVELQKAPQDDETWYCVRCTAEARGVRGKRGREEAEPRWGLKAPRTAPSWRSLIQKQFLEPGDRLYFVKDIAKCQLRHTHEGIVTDMEGRWVVCWGFGTVLPCPALPPPPLPRGPPRCQVMTLALPLASRSPRSPTPSARGISGFLPFWPMTTINHWMLLREFACVHPEPPQTLPTAFPTVRNHLDLLFNTPPPPLGSVRGLRLTGAVGVWWERADPDSLRTFDSHLEWRMQGNTRH